VPRFLLDAGLRCTTYPDHDNRRSCSPDYDDPSLRRALRDFIRAYGQRYDGDARIAFIQVGLLGFWGEWHTFPREDWFASPAVQSEVLEAYTSAFRTTRLLVRYPRPENVALGVGYHDDSFLWTTLCPMSYCFVTQLEDAGATDKWRTQPIGGEIRPNDPDLQVCVWNSPPCANRQDSGGGPIDYTGAVQTTHASWLWNQTVFSRPSQFNANSPQYARALEGARQLGYTLFISAVSLPNVDATGTFQVAIQMQNTGVAPFYYRWPVELGAIDAGGQRIRTWNPAWDLTGVMPGEAPTQLTFAEPNPGLPPGRYKLFMRVVNPLSAPPYSIAAAKPLKFTNQSQDQDVPGWLTLGSFTASGGN